MCTVAETTIWLAPSTVVCCPSKLFSSDDFDFSKSGFSNSLSCMAAAGCIGVGDDVLEDIPDVVTL